MPSLWKSTHPFQEDPWTEALPSAPSELLGVSLVSMLIHMLPYRCIYTW